MENEASGHVTVPNFHDGEVVGGKGLEVIPFPKGFLMCTEDQKPSQHQ